MTRPIDYATRMHRAFRGLIKELLADVAADGLPGAHHFFITFDTRHPGVGMAPWLARRYPSEMTVVLQHWFEGLETDDDGFAVTLNFGDSPERLRIPFDAIKTFVDPSVEFGLRFEARASAEEPEEPAPAEAEPEARAEAEVVSLDKWRK